MSEKKLVVAVVGATGAVGREMLKTLESRNFPATEVVPFASARSAGTKVPYGDSELVVRELKEDVFEGIDIAIFSAGGSTSEKYAPHAAAAGCIVVDNSSAWRMDERCPLVVPEVNPEALEGHNGIIANPNCSTIQMVVALKPLHDVAGIRRVVVSTYQAVSGSGQKGISELETQVRQMVFPTHVGVFPNWHTARASQSSLPHARGGVSNLADSIVAGATSSPRTWGCFYGSGHSPMGTVVFPTHVGVFLRDPPQEAGGRSLPHARGGVSVYMKHAKVSLESSPRTWGCFSASIQSTPPATVFPTHVGVFPPLHTPFRFHKGLPHARGGVSFHI